MAGMQLLNRCARSIELRLHVWQASKLSAVFYRISTDNHSAGREERGARIPDHVDGLPKIGKTAIDVVILLPETARFPSYFITGVVSALTDQCFDIRREVCIDCLYDTERHSADAVVCRNCFRLPRLAIAIGDSDTIGRLSNLFHFRAI